MPVLFSMQKCAQISGFIHHRHPSLGSFRPHMIFSFVTGDDFEFLALLMEMVPMELSALPFGEWRQFLEF